MKDPIEQYIYDTIELQREELESFQEATTKISKLALLRLQTSLAGLSAIVSDELKHRRGTKL